MVVRVHRPRQPRRIAEAALQACSSLLDVPDRHFGEVQRLRTQFKRGSAVCQEPTKNQRQPENKTVSKRDRGRLSRERERERETQRGRRERERDTERAQRERERQRGRRERERDREGGREGERQRERAKGREGAGERQRWRVAGQNKKFIRDLSVRIQTTQHAFTLAGCGKCTLAEK